MMREILLQRDVLLTTTVHRCNLVNRLSGKNKPFPGKQKAKESPMRLTILLLFLDKMINKNADNYAYNASNGYFNG